LKKTRKIQPDKFQQGYACAVACIISGHGEGTETREALVAGGLGSLKQLKEAGIDPYDIKILMPTIKELGRNKARRL
jgi:hypothetical protein